MKSNKIMTGNLKDAYNDLVKRHSNIDCRQDFKISMIQGEQVDTVNNSSSKNGQLSEQTKISCFQDQLRIRKPGKLRDASDESFESMAYANADFQGFHRQMDLIPAIQTSKNSNLNSSSAGHAFLDRIISGKPPRQVIVPVQRNQVVVPRTPLVYSPQRDDSHSPRHTPRQNWGHLNLKSNGPPSSNLMAQGSNQNAGTTFTSIQQSDESNPADLQLSILSLVANQAVPQNIPGRSMTANYGRFKSVNRTRRHERRYVSRGQHEAQASSREQSPNERQKGTQKKSFSDITSRFKFQTLNVSRNSKEKIEVGDIGSSNIEVSSIQNLRLKQTIVELSNEAQLLTILSKFWRCLLQLNYSYEELTDPTYCNMHQLIPVSLKPYAQSFNLFCSFLSMVGFKALNVDWTAFSDVSYQRSHVFFDRFKFDVCSLFSFYIQQQQIDSSLLEAILRNLYISVTVSEGDRIQLRQAFDFSSAPHPQPVAQQLLQHESSSKRYEHTSNLNQSNVRWPESPEELCQAQPDQIQDEDKSKTTLEVKLSECRQTGNLSPETARQSNYESYPIEMNQRCSPPVSMNQLHQFNTLEWKNSQPIKPQGQVLNQKHSNIQQNFEFLLSKSLPQNDGRIFQVPGFKFEKLEKILQQPDIKAQISLMMSNPSSIQSPRQEALHLNAQESKQNSFRKTHAHGLQCSRGLHSRNLDYEARKSYRGQKAMIRIYDDMVYKNNLQCGSRYRHGGGTPADGADFPYSPQGFTHMTAASNDPVHSLQNSYGRGEDAMKSSAQQEEHSMFSGQASPLTLPQNIQGIKATLNINKSSISGISQNKDKQPLSTFSQCIDIVNSPSPRMPDQFQGATESFILEETGLSQKHEVEQSSCRDRETVQQFYDQSGRPKTQDDFAQRDKDRGSQDQQHSLIDKLGQCSNKRIVKPKTQHRKRLNQDIKLSKEQISTSTHHNPKNTTKSKINTNNKMPEIKIPQQQSRCHERSLDKTGGGISPWRDRRGESAMNNRQAQQNAQKSSKATSPGNMQFGKQALSPKQIDQLKIVHQEKVTANNPSQKAKKHIEEVCHDLQEASNLEDNLFNDGTLMMFRNLDGQMHSMVVDPTPTKDISTDDEPSLDDLKHQSLNTMMVQEAVDVMEPPPPSSQSKLSKNNLAAIDLRSQAILKEAIIQDNQHTFNKMNFAQKVQNLQKTIQQTQNSARSSANQQRSAEDVAKRLAKFGHATGSGAERSSSQVVKSRPSKAANMRARRARLPEHGKGAQGKKTGRMYFDGLHVNMLDTHYLVKQRMLQEQMNGGSSESQLQENSEVAQICLELNQEPISPEFFGQTKSRFQSDDLDDACQPKEHVGGQLFKTTQNPKGTMLFTCLTGTDDSRSIQAEQHPNERDGKQVTLPTASRQHGVNTGQHSFGQLDNSKNELQLHKFQSKLESQSKTNESRESSTNQYEECQEQISMNELQVEKEASATKAPLPFRSSPSDGYNYQQVFDHNELINAEFSKDMESGKLKRPIVKFNQEKTILKGQSTNTYLSPKSGQNSDSFSKQQRSKLTTKNSNSEDRDALILITSQSPQSLMPLNFQSGTLQKSNATSNEHSIVMQPFLRSNERPVQIEAQDGEDLLEDSTQKRKRSKKSPRPKKTSPSRNPVMISQMILVPPSQHETGSKPPRQSRYFHKKRRTQQPPQMAGPGFQNQPMKRSSDAREQTDITGRLPLVEFSEKLKIIQRNVMKANNIDVGEQLVDSLEVLNNLNILHVHNMGSEKHGDQVKFINKFSTLNPEISRLNQEQLTVRSPLSPAAKSSPRSPLQLPGVKPQPPRRKQQPQEQLMEDTRHMFQRKRMQDVKRYNRELLIQHRKDQIELQKISQLLKVQNMYRIAQERAQHNFQMEVQSFIETAEMINQVADSKLTKNTEQDGESRNSLEQEEDVKGQQFVPLLSVEVNNKEQAGPKKSYEESVTTMGINNQRASPALEGINEFGEHSVIVYANGGGDGQLQGRSNLELTSRKLVPNPLKMAGKQRFAANTNHSETFIPKSNSAVANQSSSKYTEKAATQMPGVIPQPFHTATVELPSTTPKQSDSLNLDLGVRGIVLNSNSIQIRTSKNSTKPISQSSERPAEKYINESSQTAMMLK